MRFIIVIAALAAVVMARSIPNLPNLDSELADPVALKLREVQSIEE